MKTLKSTPSLALILSFLYCLGDAASILAFFPFPGKSHHRVFQPLIRELADRGHQVTYLSPIPMEDPPPNLKEMVIANFMKDIIKGDNHLKQFQDMNPLVLQLAMYSVALKIQESFGQMEEVRRLIDSDFKFDAVMSSSSMLQESAVALEHKFGAVGIEVLPIGSSHWSNELFGNPNNPAYVVDFKTPYTDRMDFGQRLHNTFMSLTTNLLGYFYYIPRMQAITDKYFNYTGWESRPPLVDILTTKSLVLMNSHFSVNYAAPLSPHVVEVGGLNILKNRPLPQDIQTFMDGAKDGVVILSFGTNVEMSEMMTGDLLSSFIKALGKLKQRVIWKWESDSFPGKPDNVKPVKWLPQQDLLAHKNCKLFITHGGYSSIIETVHHGVPIVGVPLFGDQRKNVRFMTTNGLGLELNFNNLTEDNIFWAVSEVLDNPSFRKAAGRSSAVFRDRPMSAVDTAVYWIEYVIRHKGAPHLRTSLTSLRWYQSTLLDVTAVVAVVFTLLLLLFYYTSRCFLRVLCRRKVKKTDQMSKKKD